MHAQPRAAELSAAQLSNQNVDAGARFSDLFLPFEGDFMLSTILSKALLLAADRSITDLSIARQIAGAVA